MNSKKTGSILLIVLSGILYGTLGLFGTRLIQEGYGVHCMLFWRFFIASIVLLAWVGRDLRALSNVFRQLDVKLLVKNSLTYSISTLLYFVASTSIGTGLSMVIFYSYPVFIFLWLLLFERQNLGWLSWVSLWIVTGGIVLLNLGESSFGLNPIGITSAIASSVLYALYLILNKKEGSKGDPILSTFILCLGSALFFAVLSMLEGSFTLPKSWDALVLLSGIAVLATAVPIGLMLQGLKQVGADLAAILSVLEPVITLMLGAVFLDEHLRSFQVLGVAIVLAGAVLATLSSAAPLSAATPAESD